MSSRSVVDGMEEKLSAVTQMRFSLHNLGLLQVTTAVDPIRCADIEDRAVRIP